MCKKYWLPRKWNNLPRVSSQDNWSLFCIIGPEVVPRKLISLLYYCPFFSIFLALDSSKIKTKTSKILFQFNSFFSTLFLLSSSRITLENKVEFFLVTLLNIEILLDFPCIGHDYLFLKSQILDSAHVLAHFTNSISNLFFQYDAPMCQTCPNVPFFTSVLTWIHHFHLYAKKLWLGTINNKVTIKIYLITIINSNYYIEL